MKINQNFDSQNKLGSIIFWSICFVLFLPIIILPPDFQPSDWTRVILFKIVITLLVCSVLYRFFYKRDQSVSVPQKNSSFYLPFIALSLFLLSIAISTIFSQDVKFSIFGSPMRAGGALNWLFFFIFTIFCALFVKGEQWNKLIKINFAVGACASLLAVVQYFGFLKNVFVAWVAPPSFLGNSTFLAIYMIFLVFSSLAFFFFQKNWKGRATYGGLFLLFLLTIIITGSRASYIGLIAGFAFYFILYPIKFLQNNKENQGWLSFKNIKLLKVCTVALISLVILIVAYTNLIGKFPSFIENNGKISYFLHNRLSVKIVLQDLVGTRFSAWQITASEIKEKPIFGWGPENFYIGFEKYFNPALSSGLPKVWFDRPHNIFLEIWASSGIFALLFYIVFWIVLLWKLQTFKNKNTESKTGQFAHCLQAMFIAYLIVLFFNFDSFSTYVLSFFFIGYSFYLLSGNDRKIILPPQKPIFAKKFVVAFALLLAIIFIWFWNIKPLYLNAKIAYAANLSASGKCNQALKLADSENWEKAGIINSYCLFKYTEIVKNCASSQTEVALSQKSLSYLKYAVDIQSNFSRAWLYMASFTDVLAAREQNADNKSKLLLEAQSYLKKSQGLSPKRQEITEEMEKNYLIAEDYKSMKITAENFLKIDSNCAECYWYLGVSEIFLGDQKNGKNSIELSKEKGYNNPAYIQLAVAYLSQNNYQDAADAYEKINIGNYDVSQKASYYATLAFLYKQTGNYTKSGEKALEVFKIQPDNPEAIQFLQMLLGLNPNDPTIHFSLAYVYKQLGQEENSHQELLTAKSIYLYLISKNYNNAGYHFQLAGTYNELKDYENAYKEALITLKLSPESKKEVEDIISTLPPTPVDYWVDYIKNVRK